MSWIPPLLVALLVLALYGAIGWAAFALGGVPGLALAAAVVGLVELHGALAAGR